MAKELAIVLNNGSVNSAVTTALAGTKISPILLHAEITQQAGSRVRAAYDQQVAHFKPYREHTLPMPFLSAVQTDRGSTTTVSDPRIPTVLAPQMLELLPLLSAAARYAAHYNAAAIYFGCGLGRRATISRRRRSTYRSGTSFCRRHAVCRNWNSTRRCWKWTRGKWWTWACRSRRRLRRRGAASKNPAKPAGPAEAAGPEKRRFSNRVSRIRCG
jgi:hypothetical protein